MPRACPQNSSTLRTFDTRWPNLYHASNCCISKLFPTPCCQTQRAKHLALHFPPRQPLHASSLSRAVFKSSRIRDQMVQGQGSGQGQEVHHGSLLWARVSEEGVSVFFVCVWRCVCVCVWRACVFCVYLYASLCVCVCAFVCMCVCSSFVYVRVMVCACTCVSCVSICSFVLAKQVNLVLICMTTEALSYYNVMQHAGHMET